MGLTVFVASRIEKFRDFRGAWEQLSHSGTKSAGNAKILPDLRSGGPGFSQGGVQQWCAG
jgi:hypothetical protein